MRRVILATVVSIAAVAAAACSDGAQGAPPPLGGGDTNTGGSGPDLHGDTTYVPPEMSDVVVVKDSQLVFPPSACQALKRTKIGSILMGDRQSPGTSGQNPEGFLRKVKSISCAGDVVVDTDPATLDEAFDDLKLDWGFDLPACKKEGESGPSLGVSYGGSLFEYTGTAKTQSGKDVPFTASAGLDSALCLSPKVKLKADVGFLRVNSFEASITGNLDAKLLVTTSVKVDPSVDAKTLAELATTPLTKTYTKDLAKGDIQVASLKIGFVKIPATAHYETTLACDFQFTAPVEAKVGATATGSLTAGLAYEAGRLHPVFDRSFTFNPVPPTFTKDGMLRAQCTITPKIELKMFGVATGRLTPRAYAGMGASQTCGGKDAQGVVQRLNSGDVEGGVSATVYGEINLLGIKKWKKECTLFDEHREARYDRAYPTPGGATATCSPAGPFPLPPTMQANPAACFGDDAPESSGPTIITGTCTHDVCTAAEKLGQQCNDCTMKVCAVDPYCCDTYWGLSCFQRVEQLCGRTCPKDP
jgi:hypothetical protein